MKFALITADKSHHSKFILNGNSDDATSFLQWVSIFDGVHLSYEALRQEDNAYLKEFDVVMMSGHPGHLEDIRRIASFLKDSQTITMFYPEGSTQLYENSINGFHTEYYAALNACDVVSIAEEDKRPYYEAFVSEETLVRFVHVPITFEMASSVFFVPRYQKAKIEVLVYGDNNPNHPLIAIAAAERLRKMYENIHDVRVLGCETRGKDIWKVFPDLPFMEITKLGLYPFLRRLGRTFVHFYPTEWIGTARQQIACAAVGTPCIGNRDSHTQQRLWPALGTRIHDVDHMVGLASELVKSDTLYAECVAHARNQLAYYDIGTTISRFMEAVNEARHRFKKTKVPT